MIIIKLWQILVSAFFIFLLTLTANSQQDGLVAYYPFNGNANDESGNGHDGTVNGATLATDRHGNTESAYSFDGLDDYIEVIESNANSNFKHADVLTFSSWVQVDSNDISKQSIYRKDHDFYLSIVEGGRRIDVQNAEDGSTRRGMGAESVQIEAGDKWYHIVTVWQDEQWQVYVNGDQIDVTNDTLGGHPTTNTATWIGRSFPYNEPLVPPAANAVSSVLMLIALVLFISSEKFRPKRDGGMF